MTVTRADLITALRADNARLRVALKLTEFGFNHTRCPVCAGFDGEGENDRRHSKECPVPAALGTADEREETA